MEDDVRLYAVGRDGATRLSVPPSARSSHEVLEARANGVYTALRSFGGQRFLGLDEHFARTEKSMELSGWPDASQRLARASIRSAMHAAITDYPGDAIVRLDVLPSEVTIEGATADTFLTLSALEVLPERFFTDGVRLEIAATLRLLFFKT